MRQAVDAEQHEQRHRARDEADATVGEASGAHHRRRLVATAFGPVPGELEELDSAGRCDRVGTGAGRARGARAGFTAGRGHRLELDQRLRLEAQTGRPALGVEAQLQRVLAGLQTLFGGLGDRLAVALGDELDVGETSQLEGDDHGQAATGDPDVFLQRRDHLGHRRFDALRLFDGETGGGANSWELSAGGVSETNRWATDSFGRWVIVLAQLGSVSSGRTDPFV